MFERFFPCKRIRSAYEIDYVDLYKNGCRALIFDIDNTLVCHGAPQSEKSLPFLKNLMAMGFKILFLSNNKEPRVKSFNDPLGAQYIYKAGKPSPKNYLKACELMSTEVSSTIFIGDQLFTDIYGGKLAGIHTILVNPIDKKEEIQVRLKRLLERPVMKFYKHSLKEKVAEMPKNRKPESKAARMRRRKEKHFSVAERIARIDRLFNSRYT